MPKDQELIIRIAGSAKQFNDELERVKKKTKDLEKGLVSVAKISGAAFTALAGAVGLAVTRFSKFESTFTNVVTLLDKGSFSTKSLNEGIAGLKEGVLAIGVATGESFETLNKGLFDLISAGVKADNAITTLGAATRLATAGATDTATAVKALTAAITAYGDDAGTADEIAEKFFTAQKFGVTTVGELAQEFNKIAGLARNVGISFDEALSAATSLTANGAKPTAEAFVEMRGAMASVLNIQGRLNKLSPAVQKSLSLQNIRQKGFVAALQETKDALGGNIVELRKLFPDVRGFSAVLSLTGAQAGTFATILREMSDEEARAANFTEALRVKQETTERAIKRLKTSVDAIAVTFGEIFAPTINSVADALAKAAQSFNELDQETKENIARFAKFGIRLTATITGLSLFGVGIIKAVRLFKTLVTVLKVGKLAMVGFTSAATFGLSAVITFLPEIISGFQKLFSMHKAPQETVGLDNIKDKLGEVKKEREELQAVIKSGDKIAVVSAVTRIRALEGERKKLEELKRQEEEFAKLTPVQREARITGEVEVSSKKDTTEDIIKAKQEENDKLIALEKQRQDSSEALRQQELEKEKEAQEARKEQALEAFNEKLEQDDELQELLEERRQDLEAKDIENLNKQLLTKEEARKKANIAELKAQVAQHNKYLLEEQKFGKAVATLNQALNSSRLLGAEKTANALVALQQSQNATLRTIGKAAAITKISIDSARGAMSAYTGAIEFLGPIIGPPVGATLAAAVVAFGVEQVANVAAAQRGGIVPEGIGGARDRVPLLAEPGELVVPRELTPDFLQTIGRPGGEEATDIPVGRVELTLRDGLMDFIEAQQVERGSLNIALTG